MISTNSNARPVLRIVVLAAGFSARLGKPKSLARVRGMSLIQRTVRLLAPLDASPMIVVVPPKALRIRVELRAHRLVFAENRDRESGLASSVRRGICQARYSAAILFIPVDLVHLERREMTRLISRWRGARRRVVARRLGCYGAAPLILPRRLHGHALGISGDTGLKDLVRRLDGAELALVDLPSAQYDVDTPRDLEQARHHARPRR